MELGQQTAVGDDEPARDPQPGRLSAAENSASWASGKCDPNTSAVVVPFAASARTNVAATSTRVPLSASRASSGSATD